MLVNHKNGSFSKDFEYSINTRFSEECRLDYNPTDETIIIDYFTDDLTTNCNCSNAVKQNTKSGIFSPDNEEAFAEKKCHCKFKFNGLNFELIEESWKKVKE